MSSKKLTTGQRLAYMLRTAVVEAQAVESGVHPNIELDMSVFRYRKGGKVCGCLGGVYAMMGRGLGPLTRGAGMHSARGVTPDEFALDDLRKGYVGSACDALNLEPIPENAAFKCASLIQRAFNNGNDRAPWNTYLEAANILEKA